MASLAILGVGTLGEVLLGGLLSAGTKPEDIVVVGRDPGRMAEVESRHGVKAVSAAVAPLHAKTLVLAVKPQDIGELLTELASAVTTDHVVISVAAGVPTSYIERELGAAVPVIRAMPNTPALVDEAMSAISAGRYATEQHLAVAESVLSTVGKVLRLPEHHQDAVTALSGSGPAYFFYMVESMIDAGILLGLPRAVAVDLVLQTALGSAKMLRDSGEHPVQLREAVTSPGGTTINAVRELEKHSVRAAVIAAIEAARDRAQQIGEQFE